MSASPPRILVAEEDETSRRLLVEALREEGFEVIEAQDGFELVKATAPAIGAERPAPPLDLIVSSVRLPGWWAIDVVARLSEHMLLPPLVLIMKPGDEPLRRQARLLRGVVILDSGADLQALRTLVRSTLDGR